MTIGEAIQKLQTHWRQVHIDVGESGVAQVSNLSTASRQMSMRGRPAKIYEQKTLEAALTSAIDGEGLA